MPRPLLERRLAGAGRVTVVCAPPGSGKTVLLRSWTTVAGLEDRVAWVSVERGQRDSRHFWVSVLDALRATPTSASVRSFTAAPDVRSEAILERLLEDLHSVDPPLWLVIDDLHELRSEEALRQLGLLVMRLPPTLRLVISTRRDPRLGQHRLRLEGEVTDIRSDELRFSADEARAMLENAGIELSERSLSLLLARTEGWAAGLRLAALSLAGHDDPDRFAREFSGSERTVAEYLLAEVLERIPEATRELLLRTSILTRVNGSLADALTGGSGGEGALHELEQANMFVVALDPERSWFRYHHLFGDLLELELRRSCDELIEPLHRTAAAWLWEHGQPSEAIRHAQAAGDLETAAEWLTDSWFSLWETGRINTAVALLDAFPPELLATDGKLAALAAAGELSRGSLDEAERRIALATRLAGAAPQPRLDQMLTCCRLRLARHRSDHAAAVAEAERLLSPGADQLDLSANLRALALVDRATAELWTRRIADARLHFEEGIAAARRVGSPYLELDASTSLALSYVVTSLTAAERSATAALRFADRHGWREHSIVGSAYLLLASVAMWRGRLDDAVRWLNTASSVVAEDLEPALGAHLQRYRGVLELGRGHTRQALGPLEDSLRLETLLNRSARGVRYRTILTRSYLLQVHLRLGDYDAVERGLSEIDVGMRGDAVVRRVSAELHLARGDAQRTIDVLAPILDGSRPVLLPPFAVEAGVLDAIARAALGDGPGVTRALERTLELAEPDAIVLPFMLHPTRELLERHQRSRGSHAALLADILGLLAGERHAQRTGDQDPVLDPLSAAELRILRYLPTNLSAPEIASELGLSVSTVKTHIQHVYAKLDVHRRADAVSRARGLGLLAQSALRSRAAADGFILGHRG